jgi:hypothetical protein
MPTAASVDAAALSRPPGPLLAAALPLLGLALLSPRGAASATLLDLKPEKGFSRVELELGGFVQPRFSYVPEDAGAGSPGVVGFVLKRARIELGSKFHAALNANEEFVLAPFASLELMPEPSAKDARVDVWLGRPLRFRFGQFKVGANRSLAGSDGKQLFPDRPFITSVMPDRDVGAWVGGLLGRNHLEYGFFLGNGEGANRVANVNRKFLLVGRVAFSPLGAPSGPEEMLGHSEGSWMLDVEKEKWRPAFTLGYAIHQNTLGPEGTEEASLGHNVELWLHWRWLTLQAEYLYRFVDFQDTTVPDYHSSGFYVQAGLFLPMVPWAQDHVAVLFRFERGDVFVPDGDFEVDLSGPADPAQGRRAISFGAAFYANKPLFKNTGDLRVSVTYSARQELEGLDYSDDELMIAAHLAL